MSKTVTLTDDLHARLERQAQRRGISVPDLIACLEHDLEEIRSDLVEERMRAEGLLLPRHPAEPGEWPPFEPVPIQ